MSRRANLAAGVVLASAVCTSGVGAVQTQRPTFTANADVVLVDVSVKKSGRQVTGLTAADFEVRDNGVPQDIEKIEASAVPIDLSIIVDVSGNPDRPWRTIATPEKVAADLDADARALTKLLRPGDRARLFAQDTYVQQLWSIESAGAQPPVGKVIFDGQSSLYDTLVTVLLQPVEATRRHVVVAATRGLDTVSVISAADVRALAEHSDAQLHLVMLEKDADKEVTVRPWQCRNMDLCSATYRFWAPPRHRLFAAQSFMGRGAPLHVLLVDGQQLKAGAEATGGGLYQGEMLGEPTLFSTFEKAFENFRQSYVLRYVPRGVNRPGWHRITVTVPKDKSVSIRARNGYSIDAPAPTPSANVAAAAAPPPSAPLRTLDDLTAAFGRGAFDVVTRSLRQTVDASVLITAFETADNPWPDDPRREAAFVLELAEAGIFSTKPQAREAGQRLLDRYAGLVQPAIDPDAFEQSWLVAATSMLQGAIRPATAAPFIDRAMARFPGEARFVLARAIAIDQRWPFSGAVGLPQAPPQLLRGIGEPSRVSRISEAQAADVVAAYEAAMKFPETAAEASIRLGWFLQRTGRPAEALDRLVGAHADPTDAALGYLQQLLIGHVLAALGRHADAAPAYRRAMTLVPGAQSARVALMNALIVTGERADAERLAEDIQTAPATVIDPWWMYWQGQYRRYPQALALVREMIR